MAAKLQTSSQSLLIAVLVTLLFSGCMKSEVTDQADGFSSSTEVVSKPKPALGVQQMPESFTGTADIQALMLVAKEEEQLDYVLTELDLLITDSEESVLREEASFRKVQLMLEKRLIGAEEAALAAITEYPDHALVPYTYFWLGEFWLSLDEAGRALEKMSSALLHSRLTRELADQVFDLAPAATQDAPEKQAVTWLLAAAEVHKGARDSWLRMAARRASMETIEQLHNEGAIPADLIPTFDLYAGRARLMTGEMSSVVRIADLLAAVEPAHANVEQLRSWAMGEIRAATIGVLLPLTGKYGRYGQEALRGIRIALASLEYDEYITLRVEDTASDANTAISAYRKLASESVNMIIGPLLAETTEALVPHLKAGLPLISLTGRTDLARRSQSLFVHTLSPLAQVYVMAEYAWMNGATRMVVITDSGEGHSEAEMFISSFQSFGGEVIQTLQLTAGQMDHRDMLRQLRSETDSEIKLAELDEDLNVYLPEMDMEIHLPANFDAVYLALDGKAVSLLAGQLAYSDISDIPLYGSSRWQDGHLLDDRGRYLSKARFAVSSASTQMQGEGEDETVRRFRFMHRDAWGDDKTSELMALAYDTMRIATVISSRLGLSKSAVARELRDTEGFPAMTGHVQFDRSGVGQKKLDIFGIKRGKIVPAG